MTRTEHLLWIIAEEAAEVTQRASKAARFGLTEIQPEQDEPLDNLRRLIYELNDLVAVAEMLEPAWMDERMIEAKRVKVEKFLRYSDEVCGTLQDEMISK